MSIRRGITRIIALVIWLFLCSVFALSILYNLGSPLTYRKVMLFVDIFFLGFYGITITFVIFVDLTRSPAEQWWDPWDSISQIILLIALIVGAISLVVFSQIESLQQSHIAPYLEAFLAPFVFVLGNYIIFCWIMDGFCGS
ncbi:MAG: hypothetical protein WC476_08265 [Phycisphaerae bacterium]